MRVYLFYAYVLRLETVLILKKQMRYCVSGLFNYNPYCTLSLSGNRFLLASTVGNIGSPAIYSDCTTPSFNEGNWMVHFFMYLFCGPSWSMMYVCISRSSTHRCKRQGCWRRSSWTRCSLIWTSSSPSTHSWRRNSDPLFTTPLLPAIRSDRWKSLVVWIIFCY